MTGQTVASRNVIVRIYQYEDTDANRTVITILFISQNLEKGIDSLFDVPMRFNLASLRLSKRCGIEASGRRRDVFEPQHFNRMPAVEDS
jgi:hypothetical protein